MGQQKTLTQEVN